jgi:hypothetical protein
MLLLLPQGLHSPTIIMMPTNHGMRKYAWIVRPG